jgi:hemerythrin-like domain-containing protein
VLRRVLIMYRETAPVLRSAPERVDAAALAQAADLFRSFGQDYHERKLEEPHVFPAVQRLGGPAGALVATLLVQHERGRAFIDYVKSKCASGRVGAGDAPRLADALERFARMYGAHATFEDTVVFQAWRNALSAEQRREMGERFEQIEREQFHGDGFEQALARAAEIERRLGLARLDRYTAPAPV